VRYHVYVSRMVYSKLSVSLVPFSPTGAPSIKQCAVIEPSESKMAGLMGGEN
jgi:hypothetical protein